ncbi:MAG: hypothetical protein ACLRSA_03320 [Streptococcus salivarius]
MHLHFAIHSMMLTSLAEIEALSDAESEFDARIVMLMLIHFLKLDSEFDSDCDVERTDALYGG